jgi:hypothetical protein
MVPTPTAGGTEAEKNSEHVPEYTLASQNLPILKLKALHVWSISAFTRGA